MKLKKQQSKFSLSDFMDSPAVEKFYNIVHELTGIAVAICTPNGESAKLLCRESDFSPVCQTILSCPEGRAACYSTNRLFCNQAAKSHQGLRYHCHAGLIDFAVPVYIEGEHIATINAGQILSSPPSRKNFEELCKRLQGIPFDEKQLWKAYKNSPYMEPRKLEIVLELFSFFAEHFCELGQRLKRNLHEQKYPQVTQAKDFIKDHFKEPITLNTVAEYVSLSENYFSKLFHRIAGISFTHYLNNIRIGEAKKLLALTDWSITRIAFEVGYNSLPHFNRVFRESEKCSPSQYREQLLPAVPEAHHSAQT